MSTYIRKTDWVYIFQSPKNDNMDDKKITLHWINSIIRNIKCIFTKLNAVFILKNGCMKKINITTDNSVTNLHQPLNSCNGCNYPRKKLFNGTNYGSYRTQICLVSCSISTCFNKGKTSYGRHYHKFCSWRATISTILNNATAQHFPVTTHAADTKQFKFNITCSKESQYTCFIVGYGRRWHFGCKLWWFILWL